MNFIVQPQLLDYLASAPSLVWQMPGSQAGEIELHNPSDLKIGVIYCRTGQIPEDPNSNMDACYWVPAVNLIKRCANYSPDYILLWLPLEKKYGTWDCDHADLLVFQDEDWADIASDPNRYLNAQWEPWIDLQGIKLWERYLPVLSSKRHPC